MSYDIRDPKRYRLVHKILKGYGAAVQFSVFRCQLDDRATAELRWKLEKAMSEADSLLVVDLCPTCAGRVISRNHVEGWNAKQAAFTILGEDQASKTGDGPDSASGS